MRALQERGLARRLPGYAGAGAGRTDGRCRGERCTVAYRTSRLHLDQWTVRWFSDTPWAPGSRSWGNPITRIVTLCHFSDLRTGDRFGVANAHWDGASPASRLRSAAALLGWLDPALPWIVVGDLNATAGDSAVAHLVAGGLRDTLAHLGERGPQTATHHPWDGSHRRHAHRLRPHRRRLGRARRPHRPRASRRAAAVGPLAGGRRGREAAAGDLSGRRRRLHYLAHFVVICDNIAQTGARRLPPCERGPGASRKDGDAS